MTWQTALYLIANVFRIFLIFYFFSIFYKEKQATRKVFIAYGIVFFASTSLLYLIFDVPFLTITCNLLFLYGTGFLYKGTWQKYLFLPIANFSIGIFTECIVAFFPMINYENVQEFYIGITSLLTDLLYLVVILLIKRIFQHDTTLPWQYWTALFLTPTVSVVILGTLIIRYTISPLQLIIIFLALAIVNISVFWLYDQISAYYQLRQEYHIAKEQVDAYSAQLSLQKQSEQKVHSIRHDMNKKLLLLRDSLARQDYEQTEQQLSSILGEVGKALPNAFSCNPTVNSMLNLKREVALQKDIDFTCQVDVQQDTPFDEMDLCVILFNLLDNAIEAQEGVTGRKYIHVKMVQEDNTWLISIRNSCKPEIKVTNGEIPRSTKGDDFSHGYGIKNVVENIKKYDGEYQIYADDGYFLFTALLNFPTAE